MPSMQPTNAAARLAINRVTMGTPRVNNMAQTTVFGPVDGQTTMNNGLADMNEKNVGLPSQT